MGLIISLIKKVDNLIIVGAMANNFIKFKGNKIGKSLIEPMNQKKLLKKFIILQKNNCEIVIPLDFAVSETTDGNAKL